MGVLDIMGVEENKLKVQIYDLLDEAGVHWQTHNNTATRGRAVTRGHRNGVPDIEGRFSDGIAFYIEAKAPGKKATADQKLFIEEARADGCFAICVDNIDELKVAWDYWIYD